MAETTSGSPGSNAVLLLDLPGREPSLATNPYGVQAPVVRGPGHVARVTVDPGGELAGGQAPREQLAERVSGH
jgi:hypothetical protein